MRVRFGGVRFVPGKTRRTASTGRISRAGPILLTNDEGQPTISFMGSGFVAAGAFFVTVFYGKTGCVNGKFSGGRVTVGR